MTGTLLDLARIFATLSLLAVGGGNTILPEMQRQVVVVHSYMSADQFAALYALAQAAPGPNMLVATLIGWHVAGLAGALVATLALCLPSSLLTLAVGGLWWRFREAAWRRRVQVGLVPATSGLILGGALVLCLSTSRDWRFAAVTALAAVGTLATRLNPLWFLAAAAGIGILVG